MDRLLQYYVMQGADAEQIEHIKGNQQVWK